jgi:hypothetical protein
MVGSSSRGENAPTREVIVKRIGIALIMLSIVLPLSAADPFERPKVKVVEDGKKLSTADIAKFKKCGFEMHLLPGMTNAQAADAIDYAYRKFLGCLNERARGF